MKSLLDGKDTTAAELAINEYVWTKFNEFKNAESADGKLDKGL